MTPRTYRLAHVGEDAFPHDAHNPILEPYTVRLRNATGNVFSEVAIFYKRRNTGGVVFLTEINFVPNEIRTFALGTAPDMISYAIGFFMKGRLVARIPETGGDMTPALAAQLDPNRSDDHTDSWAILQANLIPLHDLTYTVKLLNTTSDLWDEVAVSYLLEGQSVQIAVTSAVSPKGVATVPLGPCDLMVGYNFAIFAEGAWVDWDPRPDVERTMYPLEGSLNAWRSLEENPTFDLDPALDYWKVGE